ncbi:hypothetical protein K435DRAFT_877270 [Dendrothele bispora CBS 962.96]|uniref:Uncharacterized protein n=1 Tax=Dendrothele bispora (strain CBS 962.96) TaxID=1314807 RepID=A0A4S8KQG9_DENBC|nr:hypothetical protein K435DRAFT_877270 [Dendrothele bispora CBS 962.96]
MVKRTPGNREKISIAHMVSPVVGFQAGGDYYVLLSNPSDAQELLEKQAVLFSGRKAVVYAGKYRSNSKRMLLLPHGDALHKQELCLSLWFAPLHYNPIIIVKTDVKQPSTIAT